MLILNSAEHQKPMKNAKIQLLGWQIVAYHRLLLRVASSERNSQLKSMIDGPIEFLKPTVEHAEKSPFGEYDIEVPAPFWQLVKNGFVSIEPFAPERQPQTEIWYQLRDAIAIEIERQLAMPEAPAEEKPVISKGDEERQTTPPPDTSPNGQGSSFDDGSHQATKRDAPEHEGVRIMKALS